MLFRAVGGRAAVLLLALLPSLAVGQAVRTTPDSTNATLPYNAPQYQRDVNTEIKALWKRAPEKLGSVTGTNTVTATAAASDVGVLTAYGNLFILRPANTNTGAVTLNIDSVGAKSVLDIDGNALSAGELVAGRDHLLYYDSTAFRLLANGSAPPPTIAQPGPVLIGSCQTASSSSALTFTSGFDNTYDHYTIRFDLVPALNNVQLQLQVGTGATPTYQTANYKWSMTYNTQSTGGSDGSASDSVIGLTRVAGAGAVANVTGAGVSGQFSFSNPEGTTFKRFHGQTAWESGATPDSHNAVWSGYWFGSPSSSTAITAARLKMSSGNVASGAACMYGWPK